MRKFTLNLLSLSLGLALMPGRRPPTPRSRTAAGAGRLGESTQREDLVRQSLYRLELIDPNNPDVIAALSLPAASGRYRRCAKRAGSSERDCPGFGAYQSSRNTMLLSP
jgi:hypothetical protein